MRLRNPFQRLSRFPEYVGSVFAKKTSGVSITVSTPTPLQPMHRQRIDEPLEAALKSVIPSAFLEGGGTRLDNDNRIIGCDMRYVVPSDAVARAESVILSELRRLGVARGTTVTIAGLEPVRVGVARGVRVLLPTIREVDGVDHQNVNVNAELTRLVAVLESGLGDDGSVWSWRVTDWLGSDIIIHGHSVETIERRVRELLESEPLAEGLAFDVFA